MTNTAFFSSKLALFSIAVGIAVAFVSVPAKAVPAGSYDRTCRDIRDVGDQRRREMTAQCRDTRGNFRYSSLLYSTCRGQVSNNNGQLVCDGGRPGSAGPQDEDQRGFADQRGYDNQRDYNGRADNGQADQYRAGNGALGVRRDN